VRDLDVFLVNAYNRYLKEERQNAFTPIEAIFEKTRENHQSDLFESLDSQAYKLLCEGLSGLFARPYTLDELI
jgi:hypothetical protein